MAVLMRVVVVEEKDGVQPGSSDGSSLVQAHPTRMNRVRRTEADLRSRISISHLAQRRLCRIFGAVQSTTGVEEEKKGHN